MKYLIILYPVFCGMFYFAYGQGISEEQATAKKAYDCIDGDIQKCTEATRLCHRKLENIDYRHGLDCLNQWKDCINDIFEGCQINLTKYQ